MGTVLVENKEARVLGPGMPHNHNPIVLKPGMNRVDAKAWSIARQGKLVKARLGSTLFEKGVAGSDDEDASGLGKFSAMKALEVVKGTLDAKVLEEWLVAEKRAKVKSAIRKQLELLDKDRGTD